MDSHHDGPGPSDDGWAGSRAVAWASVVTVAAWAGLWAAGDLPAYRDAALAVLLGVAAWAALCAGALAAVVVWWAWQRGRRLDWPRLLRAGPGGAELVAPRQARKILTACTP